MKLKESIQERPFTIYCSKCKQIEDTFEIKDKETPEEIGWSFNRNKWKCPICNYTDKK